MTGYDKGKELFNNRVEEIVNQTGYPREMVENIVKNYLNTTFEGEKDLIDPKEYKECKLMKIYLTKGTEWF